MRVTVLSVPKTARLFLAMTLAVLFAAESPCFGQPRGGGGGGLGQPPRPRDSGPDRPVDDRPTGSESGWITRYDAPKEGDDENVLAYLTYRRSGEARGVVKLRVLRDEPVKFEFDTQREIEPEDYGEILTKGLLCNFSWKSEQPEDGKRRSPRLRQKDLTRVSFENFEVAGKILEIRSDSVVIRGRPTNDRPWPEMVSRSAAGGRTGGGDKPRPAPLRKVQLRIFDEVTKFLDADDKALEPADFEVDHTVEAKIVYGRRGGIALSLKSPTIRSDRDTEDFGADGGGRGGGRGGAPGLPPAN